jgi:sulfur carrier protein ThiS
MELDEGSTVKDVFQKLGVPAIFHPIMVFSVNYNKVKISTILEDGDVVSFLALLAGG